MIHDIFKRPIEYASDPVLVTVKSTECDGVYYYISMDFMKGLSENDVHWLMSCGYGGSVVKKQKIIAWMPKPEPYKEKEE